MNPTESASAAAPQSSKPAPAPVLVALRERTKQAHEDVENALIIGSPGIDRAGYAKHVAGLWGWMKPIEAALWTGDWPSSVDATARAVKTAWLEEDIAVAKADGLPGPGDDVLEVSEYKSLASRFGQAYVIEGSMLGGSVLLQRLGGKLAPWPLRYLQGYGPDGMKFWRGFLAAMAEHVVTPEQIQDATDAADEAFRSMHRWMEARGATV